MPIELFQSVNTPVDSPVHATESVRVNSKGSAIDVVSGVLLSRDDVPSAKHPSEMDPPAIMSGMPATATPAISPHSTVTMMKRLRTSATRCVRMIVTKKMVTARTPKRTSRSGGTTPSCHSNATTTIPSNNPRRDPRSGLGLASIVFSLSL